MTQLLSRPKRKTKIGMGTVLLVIGSVVYSATLWVLAVWTSTHADASVAWLATAGSSVLATVGPWLVTALTIGGVLLIVVGSQVLMDRLAPVPALDGPQAVGYTMSALPGQHTQSAVASVRADQPAAPSVADERLEVLPTVSADGTVFQVAHARTGKLIWTYAREGSALGFVRDVVRVRSHADAAQFELRIVHGGARTYTVAQGEQLVRRALEDRVL
ncbi:MAG: hypothetical protein JOZ87_32535 [Chloroflexi bacterium]|nr:hypothetical protein [Chloroflexota bacterium]